MTPDSTQSSTGLPAAEEQELRSFEVPAHLRGSRLDRVLVELLPEYSRSRLQQWISQGRVELDGRVLKPRDPVAGGEQLVVRIEADIETEVKAEQMPLEVVYADDALIVINKPAGLVVHPGAGNPGGTLQNALLHYAPELALVPRAGLVHRLDKDTSGLLVVARTLVSHTALVEAMQEREIHREYEAVVCGVMTAGGTIDQPIGRDGRDRTKMRVSTGARDAVTHYRVLERFRTHTHIQIRLETGRTHQIRVHMQHLRYPLLGDPVYGRRMMVPPKAEAALRDLLHGFRRQALHARRLGLVHPLTGVEMVWEAPLPPDMQELLMALREDAQRNKAGR